MQPPAEHVHWLFATGVLMLGLCLLAEAVVGTEVWRRRAWRAYLWPGLAFTLGVFPGPVNFQTCAVDLFTLTFGLVNQPCHFGFMVGALAVKVFTQGVHMLAQISDLSIFFPVTGRIVQAVTG